MNPDQLLVQTVIQRAVDALTKTGCKYEVFDRFGQTYTNKPKRKRSPAKNYRHYKITERINRATPSDTLVFQVDSATHELRELQSAVTARADRLLGSGNYRSEQDRKNGQVRLIIFENLEHPGLDAALMLLNGVSTQQ